MDHIREGAEALVEAGVCAIVFESIIKETADLISAEIPVPTIGIGCGEDSCDGEEDCSNDCKNDCKSKDIYKSLSTNSVSLSPVAKVFA